MRFWEVLTFFQEIQNLVQLCELKFYYICVAAEVSNCDLSNEQSKE